MGAGSGALATTYAAEQAQSTEPKGSMDTGSPVTCWILNDDLYGTIFSTCRELGLQVLKNVDTRLLQTRGVDRQVLLEELISQKPSLLLGILKAPATHIGTKRE